MLYNHFHSYKRFLSWSHHFCIRAWFCFTTRAKHQASSKPPIAIPFHILEKIKVQASKTDSIRWFDPRRCAKWDVPLCNCELRWMGKFPWSWSLFRSIMVINRSQGITYVTNAGKMINRTIICVNLPSELIANGKTETFAIKTMIRQKSAMYFSGWLGYSTCLRTSHNKHYDSLKLIWYVKIFSFPIWVDSQFLCKNKMLKHFSTICCAILQNWKQLLYHLWSAFFFQFSWLVQSSHRRPGGKYFLREILSRTISKPVITKLRPAEMYWDFMTKVFWSLNDFFNL